MPRHVNASVRDCLVEPCAPGCCKPLDAQKPGHVTRRVRHVKQVGIVDDHRRNFGKGNVGDCAPRLFVGRGTITQHVRGPTATDWSSGRVSDRL